MWLAHMLLVNAWASCTGYWLCDITDMERSLVATLKGPFLQLQRLLGAGELHLELTRSQCWRFLQQRLHTCAMTTWTTYHYIHLTYIQRYSDFLVWVIYVGLTLACRNNGHSRWSPLHWNSTYKISDLWLPLYHGQNLWSQWSQWWPL